MTDIRAGAKIRAADFPASVMAQDATEILNISSTTYIAGSPVVATTFVAPTSGRVRIAVGGSAKDGTNRVFISAQVFLGTSAAGTEILAPSVTFGGCGFPAESASYMYANRKFPLEGLTPGSTYYARVMYTVTGGSSADISCREIVVIPTS